MKYRIKQQQATAELAEFANTLERNYCDILSYQDGNNCQGELVGLIFTEDIEKVFYENSTFLLANAHEKGKVFGTTDEYVWDAVEEYNKQILGHWAYRGYIVQCSVCERYEYAEDGLIHKGDVKVCSKNCLAMLELKEEEE